MAPTTCRNLAETLLDQLQKCHVLGQQPDITFEHDRVHSEHECLHFAIFQVFGAKSNLCEYCTTVRSTGAELQPMSLRDLIVDIKNDLKLAEKQREDFTEMTKHASLRLKNAWMKKVELKKELIPLEEEKEQMEVKLERAEKRLEDLRLAIESSEHRKFKCAMEVESGRRDEAELTQSIVEAKRWHKEMFQLLTTKLSECSQLGFHHRYLKEKSDEDRVRIVNLEDRLHLLHKKKNYAMMNRKDNGSVKNAAIIEQYEDDIEGSRKRWARARQKLERLSIQKERLLEKLYDLRQTRRDMDTQLQGVRRVRENLRSPLHPHRPVQHYR